MIISNVFKGRYKCNVIILISIKTANWVEYFFVLSIIIVVDVIFVLVVVVETSV